jgi:hypothetical protein
MLLVHDQLLSFFFKQSLSFITSISWFNYDYLLPHTHSSCYLASSQAWTTLQYWVQAFLLRVSPVSRSLITECTTTPAVLTGSPKSHQDEAAMTMAGCLPSWPFRTELLRRAPSHLRLSARAGHMEPRAAWSARHGPAGRFPSLGEPWWLPRRRVPCIGRDRFLRRSRPGERDNTSLDIARHGSKFEFLKGRDNYRNLESMSILVSGAKRATPLIFVVKSNFQHCLDCCETAMEYIVCYISQQRDRIMNKINNYCLVPILFSFFLQLQGNFLAVFCDVDSQQKNAQWTGREIQTIWNITTRVCLVHLSQIEFHELCNSFLDENLCQICRVNKMLVSYHLPVRETFCIQWKGPAVQ